MPRAKTHSVAIWIPFFSSLCFYVLSADYPAVQEVTAKDEEDAASQASREEEEKNRLLRDA